MKGLLRLLLACALAAPFGARAADVIPQPAESAREQSEAPAAEQDAPVSEEPKAQPVTDPKYHSTVIAPHPLKEEAPVGEYAQPEWTTRRRFPTTRIYVAPAGQAEFEWWLETKTPFEDVDSTRLRSMYELSFGLGNRLQLDFYFQTELNGLENEWKGTAEKLELRYALAPWGTLPGNPTVYLEWIRNHGGPSALEGKVLFGGELASGWHWGANLVYERKLGEARDGEYAAVGGVSYTIIDERLSAGLELKLVAVDVMNARFDFGEIELLAGPSVQWRPTKRASIMLVALIGSLIERDEQGNRSAGVLAVPTLITGWEF